MKLYKNNKGFTLVELLAVVVIIAVIALIGTISIGSVIKNSRSSTFISNAELFMENAENLFVQMELGEDEYALIPYTYFNSNNKSSYNKKFTAAYTLLDSSGKAYVYMEDSGNHKIGNIDGYLMNFQNYDQINKLSSNDISDTSVILHQNVLLTDQQIFEFTINKNINKTICKYNSGYYICNSIKNSDITPFYSETPVMIDNEEFKVLFSIYDENNDKYNTIIYRIDNYSTEIKEQIMDFSSFIDFYKNNYGLDVKDNEVTTENLADLKNKISYIFEDITSDDTICFAYDSTEENKYILERYSNIRLKYIKYSMKDGTARPVKSCDQTMKVAVVYIYNQEIDKS